MQQYLEVCLVIRTQDTACEINSTFNPRIQDVSICHWWRSTKTLFQLHNLQWGRNVHCRTCNPLLWISLVMVLLVRPLFLLFKIYFMIFIWPVSQDFLPPVFLSSAHFIEISDYTLLPLPYIVLHYNVLSPR